MEYTEKDVRTWDQVKRKGCFYVTIPGGDGKFKASGCDGRREAVAWALMVARGGLAPTMTVAEFCSGFFKPGKWGYVDSHPDRSADYWKALQTEVDTYILPRWGKMAMDAVEPSAVDVWLAKLESARSVVRGQKKTLSARSRASVLSTMNVMWNRAVFSGVIPSNPLATVPRPERDQVKRKAFRLTELAMMFPLRLADVWAEPWGLFFLVAAETGCRPQEVAGLLVEDFRADRKAYIVHQAADRHRGVKALKTARRGVAKKAGPLSDRLTDELANFIGKRKAGLLFSRLWVDPETKEESQVPLRVDTAGDVFTRTLRSLPSLALDGRTPYCLRHTANTRMRTMLGDELARAVMGHTTEAMTRRYDDPDEEDLLRRVGR